MKPFRTMFSMHRPLVCAISKKRFNSFLKVSVSGGSMRLAKIFLVVLSFLSIAFAPPKVNAADVNARVKGVVTDPGGAVVSGAQISATNVATAVKFTTTSDKDGVYLFAELPVGKYTITAIAQGFKTFTATGIVLTIDQDYVQPIQLSVGSTTEVVQVSASAVQVNTTDSQLANVIDGHQIVELPLIGRNFTQLELTLPGVQASSDRFGAFSVSGAQTQQSSFLINGADSNDIALNTIVLQPNIDALDQFDLITGPLNAEYDRNSGGIVSATVKEGTNHFHGNAFEFYRDTFLNTANFFQHTVATATSPSQAIVSTFHQNIFGGTIGGPILKGKLFFFGAYQGTRQVVPQASTGNGFSPGSSSVYSAANLSGNFSEDLTGAKQGLTFSSNPIPGTISIPGCSTGQTWTSCLTPKGGVIPVSAFNSIALNLASKYIPPPNSGTYGYTFSPVTTTTADQAIWRVDFAPNPANQLYFVGIYQKTTTLDTLPFTGASLPGFGDESLPKVYQYTFDYVHQFSPTVVNDFAVHYTRFNFPTVIPQNIVDPSSLGFSITPQNTAAASVPTITVAGFFELGFSTNGPQPRIDQVYQIDDNFSKVVGTHALKFGYDGRRFNVSNPFSANNSGSYSVNSSSSPFSTGDASLDFLLGIPGTYAQGSGATIQADAFLNYMYGEDSWKVSSSLTLNYGLSYSIDTPLRNHQYNGLGIACLIPGQTSTIFRNAPVGVVYPGDRGCTNSAQAYTRYTELGPRIGFAWAPDLGRFSDGSSGKFAVTGGFGIYYNRTEEESALQTLETPPFGLSSAGASDFGALAPGFANPYQDLNTGTANPNRFPYVFPTAGQTVSYAATEPLGISTYGPSFRAPLSYNIQLSVQREFASQIVAQVSYVGALARRNQVTYEGNFETAAGHAACLANPNCVTGRNSQSNLFPQNTIAGSIDPNTGLTGLTSAGTVGSLASSSYHSLQVNVKKGLTHGLLFQLSYTYSHALDNGSSFENSGFGQNGSRGYNQYVPSLNYGSSAFDARQRFVFSPVYIVPYKSSDGPFSVRNLALSGWEITGILSLATGFPYDISYAGGTSRSLYCSANFSFYACPDVPLQTAPLVRFNPRTRSPSTGYSTWFGQNSFAAEPIGSFGNISRNPYHGPGINNTNVVVAKNFNVSPERGIIVQLRLESDNVFNHTQFNNPASTFGSSTFGFITGAVAGRQTQLAAKVNF